MIDLLRSASPELGVGGAVRQVLHSGHCSSLAMFAMWTILL